MFRLIKPLYKIWIIDVKWCVCVWVRARAGESETCMGIGVSEEWPLYIVSRWAWNENAQRSWRQRTGGSKPCDEKRKNTIAFQRECFPLFMIPRSLWAEVQGNGSNWNENAALPDIIVPPEMCLSVFSCISRAYLHSRPDNTTTSQQLFSECWMSWEQQEFKVITKLAPSSRRHTFLLSFACPFWPRAGL